MNILGILRISLCMLVVTTGLFGASDLAETTKSIDMLNFRVDSVTPEISGLKISYLTNSKLDRLRVVESTDDGMRKHIYIDAAQVASLPIKSATIGQILNANLYENLSAIKHDRYIRWVGGWLNSCARDTGFADININTLDQAEAGAVYNALNNNLLNFASANEHILEILEPDSEATCSVQ